VAQIVLELEIPASVIKSMSYTVVKCHDAAAELLSELRSTRQPDFWQHFSLLYEKIRKLE
ncbi:MAG: hypothetical protein ACXWBH_07455, partial [Candidatus Angelobacter sp.]